MLYWNANLDSIQDSFSEGGLLKGQPIPALLTPNHASKPMSSPKHAFPRHADTAQGVTCKCDDEMQIDMWAHADYFTPLSFSLQSALSIGSFHGIISVECNFLLNVQGNKENCDWRLQKNVSRSYLTFCCRTILVSDKASNIFWNWKHYFAPYSPTVHPHVCIVSTLDKQLLFNLTDCLSIRVETFMLVEVFSLRGRGGGVTHITAAIHFSLTKWLLHFSFIYMSKHFGFWHVFGFAIVQLLPFIEGWH